MKTKRSFITLLASVTLTAAAFAASSPVEVRVNLAHPKFPADKKFTSYLKVGLTGLKQDDQKPKRPPVNVAIVLDRSGSMNGAKLENAKQAAKEALARLGGDDVISVITFESEVQVIVPATKLNDRDRVMHAIDEIRAGGSTAIFAGVSKGAEELRKFKDPKQISRMVLLSDGLANVGPSSPEELGRLGASLAKEGITVTTLGLGLDYNERLMSKLAQMSDGNHAFIKDPKELASVFQEEFGDILSVVAQDLRVVIQCAEGVRPVRVLGREADIRGERVEVTMNQLRAGQEKYALLEVELPAGRADTDQTVADIEANYRINESKESSKIASRSVARRTALMSDVIASMDKSILVEVEKQIGVDQEQLAVKLSDEGRKDDAEKLLISNGARLEAQAKTLNAPALKEMADKQTSVNTAQREGGANWEDAKKARYEGYNNVRTQNTAK
ncbi:MAG: VWA domain-containing protein [Verrucomicrobiaceae bacterium]